MTPETKLSKIIPYTYAKQHGVIVKSLEDNTAVVAHLPTITSVTLTELRRQLQRKLTLKPVTPEEFQILLQKTYEAKAGLAAEMAEGIGEELELDKLVQDLPKPEDLLETQDDAPVIRLLNALLTQAIKQKASDIHIETFEDKVLVRYRIDGVLREILAIQRALSSLLISRVKVMAKLDIAEKRLPQDGRITLHIAGHTVDVRVSTIPSSHGERVVLRLLDRQTARLDLNLLGMSPDPYSAIEKLIASPHGIILVTGPTGSGKTTSLYAMLTQLNTTTRNILTVEDPIEYDLPGIGQTQVNTKVDMTFAKGLRAILRQDPDVVMIGEIRDLETAEIAVQASLTGHLVLSTLHTNTAIGAIARLRDMGVEPFLLASSLIGLIAQRLVRTLCPNCKTAKALSATERKILGLSPQKKIKLYHPVGCNECANTGFTGRTGIYEIVILNEKIRDMIHNNESAQSIENYARTLTPSIQHDGFRRVLEGDTTLEEVLRVVTEE